MASVLLACAALCGALGGCVVPGEDSGSIAVSVTWQVSDESPSSSLSRSLFSDSAVTSVSVTVKDSGGAQIGAGDLAKGSSSWTGTVIVTATGTAAFTCSAKNSAGQELYRGSATQTITGADDSVTITAQSATFTLTYDANGATSGSVPTDGTAYKHTNWATVSRNTGTLARANYVFTGWNAAADGSGYDYGEGTSFQFGYADVKLYARWIPTSILVISGTEVTSCSGDCPSTMMVPYGITSIGSNAFENCSSLREVRLPSTLTEIKAYAFKWCNSMYFIPLPSGLTSIGESAFNCCNVLDGVVIPASVTSIGDYAFFTNFGMSSVTVQRTTPPTLGTYAFGNGTVRTTVYVPTSALSAYQGVNPWSNYTLAGY